MKKLFLSIFLVGLLFLTSCTQCKTSSDCPFQANKEAKCIDNKCTYAEKTPSTTQTTETIIEQPVSKGDRFNFIIKYPQPFDAKKDIINVAISLLGEQKGISDRKILGLTLYDAKDKRFISSSNINKYLWSAGKELELSTDLILKDTPQPSMITDPELVINYEYKELNQPKQAEIKFKLKKQIRLQKMQDKYSCSTCPTKLGYESSCSAETDFFCTYTPKPNSCGNSICDVNENKCSCAIDCSPCKGSLKFVDFICINNSCLTKIKPNINIIPYDLRQDKQGQVDFEVHYKFNNPFNTNKDNLTIEITPKFNPQEITELKIDDILITTSGNIQITSAKDQRKTPAKFRKTGDKLSVIVLIPQQASPEEEKLLNIDTLISYKKNNNDFSEKITKNLQTPEASKITLIQNE